MKSGSGSSSHKKPLRDPRWPARRRRPSRRRLPYSRALLRRQPSEADPQPRLPRRRLLLSALRLRRRLRLRRSLGKDDAVGLLQASPHPPPAHGHHAGSLIGAALFYFGKGPTFPQIAHTPVWKMLSGHAGWVHHDPPFPLDRISAAGPRPTRSTVLPGRSSTSTSPTSSTPSASASSPTACSASSSSSPRSSSSTSPSPATRETSSAAGPSTPPELHVGFARLLYPFFAGILLMRLGKRIHIPAAFAWSSLLLAAVLCFPRVGGAHHLWANGLYDSARHHRSLPRHRRHGSRPHGPRTPAPSKPASCSAASPTRSTSPITHGSTSTPPGSGIERSPQPREPWSARCSSSSWSPSPTPASSCTTSPCASTSGNASLPVRRENQARHGPASHPLRTSPASPAMNRPVEAAVLALQTFQVAFLLCSTTGSPSAA